ncbi:hypothetical protein HDU97_007669 [Phlyctochytrium planicorne]|nr:hypothetical protein HDU97_007669 [Phlyctochytrium planicorne]
MKVLCVAEKNRAAKEIALLLSSQRPATRDTRNQYIKNYEFRTTYENRLCDVVMTSVSGHLLDFSFGDELKRWEGVPPVDLFDAPIRKICNEKNKEIKDNLMKEARKASVLVIWTDCDDEGECIGAEVAEIAEELYLAGVISYPRTETDVFEKDFPFQNCFNELRGNNRYSDYVQRCLVVLERNYLDIYPFDKWTNSEMPNFEFSQEITPSIMNLSTGATSAPNLLTEADLIAIMEKNSIGNLPEGRVCIKNYLQELTQRFMNI